LINFGLESILGSIDSFINTESKKDGSILKSYNDELFRNDLNNKERYNIEYILGNLTGDHSMIMNKLYL
jgi:hypothetical protein